jgi:hypothetical protein
MLRLPGLPDVSLTIETKAVSYDCGCGTFDPSRPYFSVTIEPFGQNLDLV